MLQVQTPIHSITDLKPGDHVCCIYDTDEEHQNIISPFLRKGLEQNEKVYYIVDARDPKTIINYLKNDGVDVKYYQKKGQFNILSSTNTYLKGGVFEPDGMMSIISYETQKALDEGYTALRGTGEMSWALRGLPGSERLIEYEDKLDTFSIGSKFLAICQYDRRCFSKELFHDMLVIHPFAIIGTSVYNNFYYVPPKERAKENQSGKKPNSWISNLMDYNKAGELLWENEEHYRTLTEATHDAIYSMTPDGVMKYVNSHGSAMMGLAPEKIGGLSFESLFSPSIAKEFRKNLDIVVSSKKYIRTDSKFRHLNQDQISWIDTHFVPQFGSDGSVVQVLGISRNITDRKQAELLLKRSNEELESQVCLRTIELERINTLLENEVIQRTRAEESVRKSLNERELLLSEIHHRVRNNLQIILSLISLKSRNIKDQKLLETMGEFQNRIIAMAHVHERMCRAEDISRIDLSEIVTFLGTSLFKSYKVDPQHIRLNVEMKDLQITIDSAIPISLIISELISNSIKHAFPKGTPGEIIIAGCREADTLVLSIRDTGIGIPKDFDWMRSKQSIGHRLVVILVEQLNGTIELDRTTGTAFNIVVHEK